MALRGGLWVAANTVGRSVALRTFLLWVARLGGNARRGLRSGVPRLLLLYLIAALLVGGYHVLILRHAGDWRWFFTGEFGPWVQAFVLTVILTALFGVINTRKRIVVLAFENLTGDPAQDSRAGAMARNLMTQLSGIAQIYETVSNEPSAFDRQTVRLALAVNAASDAFSNLTGSFKNQSLKLGFISVPIEGAITTLSTLFRGPQIRGTLQKTSEGFLIEASISGGRYDQTWRVREADTDADRQAGDSDVKVLDAMLSQLSFRIFTNLNSAEIGTCEWRAGMYYTRGLREFRTAQRDGMASSKGTKAMQQAEQDFLRAFRADTRFFRSRFNLGVIYSYQGQASAARSAFEAAISERDAACVSGLPGEPQFKRNRQDLANAHYAVASIVGETASAAQHCALALNLSPWHAEALRLYGELSGATTYASAAVASSWIRLCRSEWMGRRRNIDVRDATANLFASARLTKRVADAKQGLRLQPDRDDEWGMLGLAYARRRKFDKALTCFYAALRERELPETWAAIACALRAKGQDGKDAFGRSLALTDAYVERDWIPYNPLDRLRDASGIDWVDVADWDQEATLHVKENAALLDQRTKKINAPASPPFDQKAIDDLYAHFSGDDTRKLGSAVLYENLNALANGPGSEANGAELTELVRRYMAARPLEPLNRFNLANLYLYLSLTDAARMELGNTLALRPDVSIVKFQNANVLLNVFKKITDKNVRRKAFRDVCAIYRDMAEQASGSIWKLDPWWVGFYNFYLAYAAFELLDYQTCQQGFRTAVACNFYPSTSIQWLCLVYFRCGAVEEAEHAYLEGKRRFSASSDPADIGNLAWAANHTAAALAEHELVELAYQRWCEGVDLSDRLQDASMRDSLRPAQTLCEAVILLAAALCPDRPPVMPRISLVVPGSEEAARQSLLHETLNACRRVIGSTIESSIRADALFRIALASEALAEYEPFKRDAWRRYSAESLSRAEDADRRDEYVGRIERVRQRLQASAGPSQAQPHS